MEEISLVPTRDLKVTLIRPPVLVAKWAHTTPTCPPVGLAYIASSLIGDGYDVSVIDAIGENPDQYLDTTDSRFYSHGLSTSQILPLIDPNTNVVGVSCMFSHEWPLVRDLINAVKNHYPHIKIVAGGEHITALPEFSLRDCVGLDFGVFGEGEEVILNLLAAIESNLDITLVKGIVYRSDRDLVKKNIGHSRIRAIDEIPLPAWHLFPISAYLDNGYGFGVNRGRSMPIVATRGCPYQCTFCSSPSMWGTQWTARNPNKVLAEITHYVQEYRAENIDFYDLTAIVKKKWAVEFTDLVRQSNDKFTWQLPSGTRSEAIDDQVSAALYDSGCRNMSYAPESGSKNTLKRIKKKVDLTKMKRSIKAAVKNGVNCKANIIIGFPGETHRDVILSLKLCFELAYLGLHDLSISPFSPYPGTELFDEMRDNGQIPELNDHYFFSLAAYTDITKSISYSEHIGDKMLNFYRIFGMVLFYGTAYLSRPYRIINTLKNVFAETQESRLEMSLRDLFKRLIPQSKI